MGKDDEPTLPPDIKKEEVRKGTYPHKTPKKGDDVRIHYTGSRASDGMKFDSSYMSPEGKPYSFKLGVGHVMEAWDRVVPTMKKGELARFTIPEMYLFGGPKEILSKIPDEDDCAVIYEIELVGVTSITDLLGDGGVMQTGLDDGEDYARPPKVGDEVQINYELQSCSGDVLEKRSGLDHKIGFPFPDGIPAGKALDKALLSMKRNEVVSLRCRPQYAFGEIGNTALGISPNTDVTIRLELNETYEVEDAGKKASWGEGIVVKKATKVIKGRLVPGFDGTKCTVKLLKVTSGDLELISEEQMFEFTPGNGDLCDALECGCARMRKGEVALLTVNGPEDLHAPGKPGLAVANRSRPVVYHVEMVDFAHPPSDDGPSGDGERLRFCAEQKDRGGAHFKSGRVRLAQERYARVIELLPRYKREGGSSSIHVDFFEYGDDRKRAQELIGACKLNLAACALKLEEFYSAARHCDEILKEDPKNLKALYRRAQGRVGTKDFDDATRDCKRILELDPENKDAQLLMQKVARLDKEQAKAARAQFAGKLNKF